MVTLILGIILLAIPFLLMDLFSDKKKGFIYVLFFIMLFQSVLGMLTQLLGIFYYDVILGCTLLADIIAILIYFVLKSKSKKGYSFKFGNMDWIILTVAAISVLTLYQVHYNYTGQISLATDTAPVYHQVKNVVYPYPYFSDEWYAVSLVEGAISHHSLPVINILSNSFFFNLEVFFHSFIAEIVLLLGLNPLLQYTMLGIFFNSLIILLIYLFLRISKIPKLASAVSSLFGLYIAVSGNLPGIWHLIPFTSGIIFFLFSICFMEFGEVVPAFLALIASSAFYPPLFPFCFVGFIVFLFTRLKMPKDKLFKLIAYSFLTLFFIVPLAYILIMISPLSGMGSYFISRIFFITLTAPYMVQLAFFNVIPIFAILLAILGLHSICKNKKWILLSEFILGAVFWFFYSFTLFRFFIEFERVAIFTGIIVVIIAGFGLAQIENYIKIKFQKNGNKIIKISEVIILLIFLILVPFYTQSENWKNITEIDPKSGDVAHPKSPANGYLTADDLRIFKNIKGKRFLSLPWKGTVIGVSTGNYPILVKDGNISIGSPSILDDFSNASCSGKEDMAKKFNLDYIYVYEFNCPGFKKIDKSQEGFVLYKTDKL